ncbi:hypothetical protein [uncultured Halomonas sp.]|uniref:hypothetical protein n=1 Tax=uncultured Halomonas sp. TaxID=173971 RepID=UPI002639D438|nr:hypothetical protein [uncultured Halomonas sp.]
MAHSLLTVEKAYHGRQACRSRRCASAGRSPGLAYFHFNEPDLAGSDITYPEGFREQMRRRFKGGLIY